MVDTDWRDEAAEAAVNGDTMYCDYCYEDQPVELGPDGSVVVCSVCQHGLAPVSS
jgi:hypothetical protein